MGFPSVSAILTTTPPHEPHPARRLWVYRHAAYRPAPDQSEPSYEGRLEARQVRPITNTLHNRRISRATRPHMPRRLQVRRNIRLLAIAIITTGQHHCRRERIVCARRGGRCGDSRRGWCRWHRVQRAPSIDRNRTFHRARKRRDEHIIQVAMDQHIRQSQIGLLAVGAVNVATLSRHVNSLVRYRLNQAHTSPYPTPTSPTNWHAASLASSPDARLAPSPPADVPYARQSSSRASGRARPRPVADSPAYVV